MSAAFLSESSQVYSELVADAPIFSQPLLFCAPYEGGIFKAPVKALGAGGEEASSASSGIWLVWFPS